MAVIFTVALAIVILCFLLLYGKNESFLVINRLNSPYFDPVFKAWTYLGDGLIWVPLFLYTLIWKREFFVPILSALIISTLLTHLGKRILFPNELRPIAILKDQVRVIQGYYINRLNSFPSGHTTTAFTLALLLAYEVKRNWCDFIFPIIAFFVGYSRVYLAQHFVTDVLGGVCIGILSAYLSLLIYKAYIERKEKKNSIKKIEQK